MTGQDDRRFCFHWHCSVAPQWARRRVSKVSALILEIRLNKFGTGVDVDLPQRRLAGIDETVRRICRNNHNAARFYFTRFITNCDRCCTFNREGDFTVRMRM